MTHEQRGSSRPENESIRAGLGRPLLDPDEAVTDLWSPHCCFDEPVPRAERLLAARLRASEQTPHPRVAGAAPPRQAQGGSASPSSMASNSRIARSMRQSDAEIETIAARPEQQRRERSLARSQIHGEGGVDHAALADRRSCVVRFTIEPRSWSPVSATAWTLREPQGRRKGLRDTCARPPCARCRWDPVLRCRAGSLFITTREQYSRYYTDDGSVFSS